MKFILALSIVALAAAGCGQNHSGDRSTPTAPASNSSNTKDNLLAALNNIPGQSSADSASLIAALGTDPQTASPSDITSLQAQIGFQQNMLFAERKALDDAINSRNNTVHLGADFMDAAAYGISSGYLGWDFLRRQGYLKKDGAATTTEEVVAGEGAAASEGATVASTAAAAFREVGPVTFKVTEAGSAAVLGLFFLGKTLQFGKDVNIRFTDTNAIRSHRAKVAEAEKNLENAKANLAAIYSPDNNRVVTQ